MFKIRKGTKGISLIEAVFGLAIIALLLALAFRPFTASIGRQSLSGTVSDIENILQEAKTRTISGVGSAQYGVRFEEDRVIIFKNIYSASDPDNETLFLDKRVHITDTVAGQEVLFKRLTGETDDAGNIVVSTLAEPVKSSIIIIYTSGAFLSQ